MKGIAAILSNLMGVDVASVELVPGDEEKRELSLRAAAPSEALAILEAGVKEALLNALLEEPDGVTFNDQTIERLSSIVNSEFAHWSKPVPK